MLTKFKMTEGKGGACNPFWKQIHYEVADRLHDQVLTQVLGETCSQTWMQIRVPVRFLVEDQGGTQIWFQLARDMRVAL